MPQSGHLTPLVLAMKSVRQGTWHSGPDPPWAMAEGKMFLAVLTMAVATVATLAMLFASCRSLQAFVRAKWSAARLPASAQPTKVW